MKNNKKETIVIVINDNDANDTQAYLKALKRHKMGLKEGILITGTYTEPIIKSKGKKDDEEARATSDQVNVLDYLLGLVDNKAKVRGQKLTTAKSIKSFMQQQRDDYLNNKSIGSYGEIQAFMMDLADAKLYKDTQLNLFPVPETMTHEHQIHKLNVLEALQDMVIKKRKAPSSLKTEEVVEIVLNKYQNLAKEDNLINIVKEVLHRR
jgi:phage terminase small subunit